MSTIAVIPARYGATRLPGKPLLDLDGKPLICHVVDRAREAASVDEVLVATDDERILRAVEEHGAQAVMTSPDCASGSDRIAQAVEGRDDIEIVVNVQGDEPLMPPEVIDAAVEALCADPECGVSTAMIRIRGEEEYRDPGVVKVVCDARGRALYFSRSPIPCLERAAEEDLVAFQADPETYRNPPEGLGAPLNPVFWGYKHFGLYVYRRKALLDFVGLASSRLERVEKLEQLRFIENGKPIRVVEVAHDSVGVDTPEDLEHVRALLAARRPPQPGS